jgi:murein hydrolase activator
MIQLRFKVNKVTLCLLLFLLFKGFFGLAQKTASNKTPTQKELENKKKKLNEDIHELNGQLSETKASKKSKLGQLVALNKKISIREELIGTINSEINQINTQIKKNEQESDVLRKNLEKLKADYGRMLQFAQRNHDAYSNLMFIFAAQDFNQAYMRLKYMQQYTEFRKKQANEIMNAQTALLAKLNELKDNRHEKNVLLGNEEEEKKNLDSEKQEQETVLTSLQEKEKEIKTELEKKKRDIEQLQITIRKLIEAEIKRKAEEAAAKAKERAKEKEALAKAEKTKASANSTSKKNNVSTGATSKKEKTIPEPLEKIEPKKETLDVPELNEAAEALSEDFANNRGRLPWPVGKGVICEAYGEHEHPAIKGFMIMNNGVEICTSKGVQARAIFDGEVTGIAVSPTGGSLVIVRHGEYLSIYNNVGDVVVKTGDKIKAKQIIGTILFNDDEGKASLNLQIWKGKKTMDPSGWLVNAR